MKNIILSGLAVLTFIQLQAQKNGTGVIVSSEFSITRPLSEIFAHIPPDYTVGGELKESKDRDNREPQKFLKTAADGPEWANDPRGIQTEMGQINGTEQRVSWGGGNASGFRPFDPSGAVGPNHYVQMINATTFRVYTKTGTILMTGVLGNLWSPPTGNSGDPIVLYDKAADRWLLAQFGNTTDKKIYIAISTTNDPTLSYYTYTFVSPQFPDYLKFSVWHDGYYMTSNQTSQKVFAFERSAMLTGTPGARALYVSYSPPKSGFFTPLAADASDGTLPPAGTPCPIISYSDNGWGNGFTDAVNIYNMTVNWAPNPPTGVISLAANVATQPFDASYNSRWNDCSQPGTRQKLDGIGGVCMYRAQWKSWAGYNTVVLNWGVKINNNQRSIKWAEVRQNQASSVWSMYQEGIYVPDANTRWMGSIAMDNNGSIGLNYIKSNATNIYPGLYYTGRRECDPLGTLPVTEVLVVAGTGSQTNTNRVGDYAQTCLDPDGVTFWATSEYMGGSTGSSAARTHIFSYQIAACTSGLVRVNPLVPESKSSFESIFNVNIGSINNISSHSSYSNFSNLETDVAVGYAYPVSVILKNAFSTDKIKIWCDWNQNGSFTDEGEEVYRSGAGIGPFNTAIRVPSFAIPGKVVMRVKLIDSSTDLIFDPGLNTSFGEIEDYTLNVVQQTSIADAPELDVNPNSVMNSNLLQVFPNPNNGAFTIQSSSGGEYYILNESGKLIETFRLNESNHFTKLVFNLTPGFYILSGQNEKGISKQKIIVNTK